MEKNKNNTVEGFMEAILADGTKIIRDYRPLHGIYLTHFLFAENGITKNNINEGGGIESIRLEGNKTDKFDLTGLLRIDGTFAYTLKSFYLKNLSFYSLGLVECKKLNFVVLENSRVEVLDTLSWVYYNDLIKTINSSVGQYSIVY